MLVPLNGVVVQICLESNRGARKRVGEDNQTAEEDERKHQQL